MKAELLVGATVAATPENVLLDRDVLTTHGVILGMTGSGKTGLAIVLLEELARKGVPLVICDLKGDMTNLLLNFPALAPADFAPWLPATQAGGDRDAAAQAVAAKWRDGLAEVVARRAADARGARRRRLAAAHPRLRRGAGEPAAGPRARRPATTRTSTPTAPGRASTAPRPACSRSSVAAATRSPTATTCSSRRCSTPPGGRQGRSTWPSWSGRSPSRRSPASVCSTPRRSTRGRSARSSLLAFNTVLASPAFGAWTRGTPLAIEELIGAPGAPRATILYLAHLAERERLSFLTLLFSDAAFVDARPARLRQRCASCSTSTRCRASCRPPRCRRPSRRCSRCSSRAAHSAPACCSPPRTRSTSTTRRSATSASSCVGRLDTENDRRRALEGLDVGDGDRRARPSPRCSSASSCSPERASARRASITSRWAMSYLRGPLTLAELKPLLAAAAHAGGRAPASCRRQSAQRRCPVSSSSTAAAPGSRRTSLVEAEVVYRKPSPAIERRIGRLVVGAVRRRPRRVGAAAADRRHGARGRRAPAGATLGGAARAASRRRSRMPRGLRPPRSTAAPSRWLWHRALKLVQEDGEPLSLFEERCRRAAPSGAGKEAEVRRRYEEKLRRVDEKLAQGAARARRRRARGDGALAREDDRGRHRDRRGGARRAVRAARRPRLAGAPRRLDGAHLRQQGPHGRPRRGGRRGVAPDDHPARGREAAARRGAGAGAGDARSRPAPAAASRRCG